MLLLSGDLKITYDKALDGEQVRAQCKPPQITSRHPPQVQLPSYKEIKINQYVVGHEMG